MIQAAFRRTEAQDALYSAMISFVTSQANVSPDPVLEQLPHLDYWQGCGSISLILTNELLRFGGRTRVYGCATNDHEYFHARITRINGVNPPNGDAIRYGFSHGETLLWSHGLLHA
jgi:hypothetical protein